VNAEETSRVLWELHEERERQDAKWGEQNHPLVEPDLVDWIAQAAGGQRTGRGRRAGQLRHRGRHAGCQGAPGAVWAALPDRAGAERVMNLIWCWLPVALVLLGLALTLLSGRKR
jgi:hypothetical protein